MHDHNHEKEQMSVENTVNVCMAIVQTVSHMPELFVRRPGSFGSRYVGIQFVLSWAFLFFCPMLFQGEDPTPVLAFWLVCTLMLLVHRIAGAWRREETHSLFIGRSWFKGGFSASSMKEFVFLICIALGALTISVPLATYLMVSAVCLLISMMYVAQAEKARLRAAIDARLDAELMQKQLDDRHK